MNVGSSYFNETKRFWQKQILVLVSYVEKNDPTHIEASALLLQTKDRYCILGTVI